MIDMTKSYKTRRGIPVRVLCVDAPIPGTPVVVVTEDERFSMVYAVTAEGRYLSEESNIPCQPLDLVEEIPKKYIWLNLYPNFYNGYAISPRHDSKASADEDAAANRVGCIKVLLEARFDKE